MFIVIFLLDIYYIYCIIVSKITANRLAADFGCATLSKMFCSPKLLITFMWKLQSATMKNYDIYITSKFSQISELIIYKYDYFRTKKIID